MALAIGGTLWFDRTRALIDAHGGAKVLGFLERHGMALALFVSILPLVAVWSGAYVHWGTMYGAFLGRIPWSDSSSYYAGAAAFLEGGELSNWTSRRPMNTLFMAIRYLSAGRWLEGALVLQALIGGVALFVSTRRVAQYFGAPGAAFFFGVSYAFYRVFAPTTMSDALGLSLGLMAIPLLLDAVYRPSDSRSAIWAIFVLALGQVIRPGAMFVLPVLVCWVCIRFGRSWRHRFLVAGLAAVAIAVPNLTNRGCLLLYGPEGGGSGLNSNFSLTFYGLTIGTDWKAAESAIESGDVQVVKGGNPNDAIYRQGFANIRKNPEVFASTLIYNLGFALVTLPAHVGDMLFGIAVRADGFTPQVLIPFGLLCILLFCPVFIALGRSIQRHDIRHFAFWAVVLASMVASFPIIIRDGSFRVLAATYPLFSVMLAVLLSRPEPTLTSRSRTGLAGAGVAVALLIVVLVAPLALVSGSKIAPHEDGDVIVVARNEIQAVLVTETPRSVSILSTFQQRVTPCSIDEFRHLLRVSRVEFRERLSELPPPFTLLIGLEDGAKRKFFMVLPEAVESFDAPYYRFSIGPYDDGWRDVRSFAGVEVPLQPASH